MARSLTVALAADHGGFELKQALLTHLTRQGHFVRDCGTNSTQAVDYPTFAFAAATMVASRQCDFAIVIDGAGIGSAITANKVPGVRAAACTSEILARNAREHNDANVLSLGAGQVTPEQAEAITDTFLTSSCTEQRHRRRVAMITEIENRAAAPELDADDLTRLADRVKRLMTERGISSTSPASPRPDEIAALIDHTLLRPDAVPAEIEKLCAEAREYSFYSVCVNPSNVRQARSLLRGSAVKVCCVVGFPLGAQPPESKAMEARRAIREGASEIDMVINIGSLKAGDNDAVHRDIRAVVEACKDGRARSKVILETSLLTDEEKERACLLAMKAGADYVKTSTGFSKGGATVADIALMSRTVAPRKLGVKASGGIRTLADLLAMVRAGATRIGASASVSIMNEARQAAGRKE
ncbi:MAG: deoxyribose-phosphate aldolase [Acidobacteria bacterium]|nr:deoxyribose-phosphate aldolase [Acidobacteriota bacterium]